MKLLNGTSDWNVLVDLMTSLEFLEHIQTDKRPDIVMWTNLKKSVFLIELSLFWEENMEEVLEQKKKKRKSDMSHCLLIAWKRDGHVM